MKLVAALILFFAPFLSVKCQMVHGVIKNRDLYKAAIRFNFSGLLDPIDNNVSVGGEYAFHPQWSVTADVAWIDHSLYYSRKIGFASYILRPAIRYYPSVRSTDFIEVSLFYKHVNYRIEDWLGKDVVNGVPAYEKFQKFTYGKRIPVSM